VTANLTGTAASSGKYESGVTVIAGGVIQIIYGGKANKNISGSVLDLIPWTDTNNDILWQCGSAGTPNASATVASGATATAASTTVSAQYLPTACHS
jgi:hypothetical protein